MTCELAALAEKLGIRIDLLGETGSTNDEARAGGYGHGDIVVAESQTAGRGQRGNTWESAPGENLTFSLVLHPGFLAPDRQFLLSEAVSLVLADMLTECGIHARIKWPNDIYAAPLPPGMPEPADADHGKIAGILIENDIRGSAISRSIVGIGLNVNQHVFSEDVPNPVSMIVAGREFDRAEVLEKFYLAFAERYAALAEGDTDTLEKDYHDRLWLKDTTHTFRLPDGTPLRGAIRRVMPTGELIVELPDGTTRTFLFKEIEFRSQI